MTLSELADEMRPLFNEICMINDSELVRLVGVAQDEMDLYYIVHSMQPNPTGSRVTFASAVGHCYSLKAHLPAERYAQTDSIFAMNGAETYTPS
jgi:hypothetical protein